MLVERGLQMIVIAQVVATVIIFQEKLAAHD
jgi:hypothetical protein